jgi:ATP-dependent DNA helicase PIF1
MTINKSQGQNFERVSIYLRTPVFSHGQLYVAFSRSKSKDNIRIQIEESEIQGKIESKSNKVFTLNRVYGEIYGDQQYY